ncbi:fatty acyl-CoA reductase wat [Tetranychus urticae]|uniref:Fatty acyl-CoA reductase n=1 Tax=Tetranychus urticae TaxID=32264 RepID=T1K480_TETUR|nr:fatty acyl-CoA reductase wat [Tetranychus urticae]
MESEVCQFYEKRSVLVTGGTGLIGKCLVYNLLANCPDVGTIYLLLRKKREFSFDQRRERYLNYDIFKNLKTPNLLNKLVFIEGAVDAKNLGLSNDILSKVTAEVSILFHSAASVGLEAGYKGADQAANSNLRGTMNVLELCRSMTNLACLVYVSTATAYHFKSLIEEKIYPVPCTPEQFLSVMESGDAKAIDKFLREDMKMFPNAYTLTKALSENLCQAENSNIPICIVRPPIVSSSVATPVPGWTNKMQAFNAMILLWVMGLSRCLTWDPDTRIEVAPVDYVCNVMITAAWFTGQKRPVDTVPVYNVVPSEDNSVTWRKLLEYSLDVVFESPSIKAIRWPGRQMISPKTPFKLLYSIIFQHIIFAIFSDLFLICTGSSPQICALMIKMVNTIKSVRWFLTKDWHYINTNYLALTDHLNEHDRKLFPMSMKNMDWKSYIHTGYYGIRKFVLHEDDDNTKAAIGRLRRLTMITNGAVIFAFLMIISTCFILVLFL